MTEMKNSQCTLQQCNECEFFDNCPFDDVSDFSEKNRSLSRRRHLNSIREKHKALENAYFLSSKANKIPFHAPWEEHEKADKKADWAVKRSHKFKKQFEEQEQLHTKKVIPSRI